MARETAQTELNMNRSLAVGNECQKQKATFAKLVQRICTLGAFILCLFSLVASLHRWTPNQCFSFYKLNILVLYGMGIAVAECYNFIPISIWFR